MPWNEPGDPTKNKDPWTGRPKKQTPPDLESFLRDLFKKVVALFKLRILNKKSILARPFLPTQLNAKTLGLISIACLLAWLALGFFKVNPQEQAVITRFGKYTATVNPGYHWIFKPFQHYTIINYGKVDKLSTSIQLLTQNENKISVDAIIDYSIVNPRNYLFSTAHPLLNLQEAVHSEINRLFSQLTLNQLVTATSNSSLTERLQKQLNSFMTKEQTGLAISHIELTSLQIPASLQASFTDAANAKRDKEQLEKRAHAYAIQVEPRAKALAQRLITLANTDQQETILKAKTDVIRFLALLPAYESSPSLTQKRLYLAALQTMMEQRNKRVMSNNDETNLSLTLAEPNATLPVDADKLTSTSSINDKKENIDMETHGKTDNIIPSSYHISGGYE